MKKISLFLLAAFTLMILSSCGAALYGIQLGLGAIQIAAPLLTSNESSNNSPDLVLEKELARHQINQFEVRVNDGYYKNEHCINFAAYEKNESVTSFAFLKSNQPMMQKIKGYIDNQSEIEKIIFIKQLFLTQNFDLGPIDTKFDLGKEKERMMIGKYEVRVVDGYYEKEPCIYFIPYNNNIATKKVLIFRKNDIKEMKIISDFNSRNESGKKLLIRDEFNKVNFNLDSIESK